jgi:topoisomerase (fragment)
MITYLAEKRDQGIAYYMALASDNTLSATQLDEKYKKQGYIQFKNAAYHNGELITIIWAQGHMLELKEPEDYKADWKEWRLDTLPIIPEKFEYKVMSQKERQFKKVKDFFDKSRMIVWATDIDREGSHIAYSISLMAGILDQKGPKKIIKSLWVDELTPTKIQEGVKKLREIEYRVLQATEAQTRAIADWLLGMNASRALSLLLEDKIGLKLDRSGKDGKIAVGRIKTVALFLIYLRELAIRDFVPTTYWELEAIRRTLAMFFPKYEYEQTTIITQVGAGRFKTVGQVPKNPGWQVLFQDSASLLDGVIEESEARGLVKVQINSTVTSHLVPAERHVKKPPRHTNSTWLRALRTAGRDLEDEELIAIMNQIKGLGTAATRGAILDEIVVNKWVIVKQGKIYLSELGWLICETLKDERVLSQPETTAIWEQSLSKIAEGTNTQEKFLKNIYRYLGIENPHNNLIENLIKAVDRTDYVPFQDFIEQAVAKADGKLGNCPLCGKAVKVLGKSKVAQCEDNILSKEERETGTIPICSFNFWITVGFIKDKKKTLTKKQISDLLSDKGRTNLIKNIEGKYGPFDAYAYLSFNEEKGIYQVNLEVDKATSKK